jgi:hypothetical protein
LKKGQSRELVAHARNPSYSGGRDQEDYGLKPALGKQFVRPYLINPITKRWLGNGSSIKRASLASVKP